MAGRQKLRFTIDIESREADGQAWIHLCPSGQFMSIDGRGPFVLDAQAVLENGKGKRLPIDINHAIDWNSGFGGESPAYGWIIELAEREDGIWGQVEWTKSGKALLDDKAYGFISPVFYATAEESGIQRVYYIESAALCNNPALPQLKGLFTRQGDGKMEKELMTALGLPEGSTAEQAVQAAQSLSGAQAAHKELLSALQKMTGADGNADEKALMTALQEKLTQAEAGKTALEKSLSELNAKLTTQMNAAKREKAEAFVSAAQAQGKIIPALKEHYIERFMREPEAVEKEVSAFVSVNAGGASRPPENTGGLSPEDKYMCSAMGLDPKAYAETQRSMKEML